MKKLFGVLLILLGIGILFFYLADNLFMGEIQDKQSVSLSGVETLKINVPSAQLKIIPDKESNELSAVLQGKGIYGTDLFIQRQDKTVEVQLKPGWFNLSHWIFFHELTMEVYLPADYQQDLIIEMIAGKIEFDGSAMEQPMQLNNLSVDNVTGEVNLKHLTVRDFTSNTTAGEINIQWLTAEAASFKVTSGDIQVTHFTGAMAVNLISGEFYAQIDELSGDVHLDMTIGDASFDLPDDADFTLNGQVKFGDVRCDFPLQNAHLSADSIRGQYGDGRYKIKLRGTIGDVAVY